MKFKIINILLLCISVLINACNSEDLNDTTKNSLNNISHKTHNTSNPYEHISPWIIDLTNRYSNAYNSDSTFEQVATRLNLLIDNFTDLPQTTLIIDSVLSEKFIYIKTYPEYFLEDLSSEIQLTSSTKSSFHQLAELANRATQTNYFQTINDIIVIEDYILSDNSNPTQQNNALLILSSIIKQAITDNGGTKDKDWDLSVGNITLTFYGALQSPQDALLLYITDNIINWSSI